MSVSRWKAQACSLLTPGAHLSDVKRRQVVLGELILFATLWIASPFKFLPRPGEVFSALGDMWMHYGLAGELVTSLMLNVQALLVSTFVSLGLAYLSTIGIFRPPVMLVGKLRFLSLMGLTFFVTLMTSTGHQLKLVLEVFSITVFFVTGMLDVVAAIPKEKYDLARTLGMGPWETLYQVVILGQMDKSLDALRQNAAMGWMMLAFIEAMARSEGGVGALMLTQDRHFYLAAVIGLQLCIFALGVGQDYAIAGFRKLACPYADLTMEHR